MPRPTASTTLEQPDSGEGCRTTSTRTTEISGSQCVRHAGSQPAGRAKQQSANRLESIDVDDSCRCYSWLGSLRTRQHRSATRNGSNNFRANHGSTRYSLGTDRNIDETHRHRRSLSQRRIQPKQILVDIRNDPRVGIDPCISTKEPHVP